MVRVSDAAMISVYAYTNCLPLNTETVLTKLKFSRNCDRIRNSVLRFLHECFVCKEFIRYCCQLNMDEVDVNCLPHDVIRTLEETAKKFNYDE